MAIPALDRCNLFLRIPVLAVPNSRAPRPHGDSSRRRIPAGGGKFRGASALLVRTNATVVQRQFARADGLVLGRLDRVGAPDPQHLAARYARVLLRVLSFVCERRFGILRLSVRRYAAGSRIYCIVPRSSGMAPGTRPLASAHARQCVPFALGVVPDLF